MQISSLRLANWRQFEKVEIDFHPRLTILTGPNGAGKTTILNMLSRLLGWSIAMLSLPDEDREAVYKDIRELSFSFDQEGDESEGSITLSGGEIVKLGLSKSSSLETNFAALKNARGVYIISHRQIVPYTPIKHIPTSVNAAHQILSNYTSLYKASYNKIPDTIIVKSEQRPSFKLKEALISLAVFGEGNSIVSPNHAALETFRGFESILRAVLPEDMGFQQIHIRMPEVLLVGRSGVFPLEAVSGGAAAIIDVAWQIFLASKVYDNFLVLFDEPENHLHPSLQRSLLGNLIQAFPTAQFVVSTHSPLMITSVEDSLIYVLSRGDAPKYSSRSLNFADRAGSAEQTLNEVLGVETSTPLWASQKIEQIVEKYEKELDDPVKLSLLTRELSEAGLNGKLTEILRRLVEADRAKN